MIKIFIFGITGKIGKNILNFIKLNNNFILIGGINKKNYKKFLNNKYNFIFKLMNNNSIIIDFSNHYIIKNILFVSLYYKIPIIIGTTGFNFKELKYIKFSSKYVALILSYNMSIGVNMLNLFFLNLNFFFLKFNFNSIIIDIHHNKKKDAPSGTALIFYSKLKNINLNIFSSRIKNIIGNHIIYLISNYEIIKFEHYVINRNIFIIGIFYSIIWLMSKKKGCFSMYNVFFSC
ncbi:dihydrodipicolinate reductase C-terminal domain-containing protein [Candidatus Carsonella ruddii]|uniref:4-hydroxy-tetrahydrodipicolinate reductase n=1 Tax=Candidatus Carsonella ruddii PC isolate NHV TaxID=1202540 RepID=J3VQQ5_CARRU|nr:dihydrodipicolinate reductase C-terminal domain-containing protein [Candidatus Carsonella ruddii]AFP84291.1 dihydrodipicolinate reductase [Candidatus Carsonella ruddii PC isolate NHV]